MAFKTDAIVLKSKPWRAADRLYYLFTPHEGIIHGILKSAAKPGNKLAGHLIPFTKVRVMIGRGKMDHVAGVDIIRNFNNIKSNLKDLSLASSIAELFLNAAIGGSTALEYSLLEDILNILDTEKDLEKKLLLVRVFLWKFLSVSGWQPQLDICQLCGKNITTGQYLPGRGIICSDHSHSQAINISPQLIDLLRKVIKANWTELYDLEINKNLNREWLKISQLFYQTVYERPSQALKLFTYG